MKHELTENQKCNLAGREPSEMMDFANIDHRHGDYSDSEIEEFCEIEAEQAAKVDK